MPRVKKVDNQIPPIQEHPPQYNQNISSVQHQAYQEVIQDLNSYQQASQYQAPQQMDDNFITVSGVLADIKLIETITGVNQYRQQTFLTVFKFVNGFRVEAYLTQQEALKYQRTILKNSLISIVCSVEWSKCIEVEAYENLRMIPTPKLMFLKLA